MPRRGELIMRAHVCNPPHLLRLETHLTAQQPVLRLLDLAADNAYNVRGPGDADRGADIRRERGVRSGI